MTSAFHFIGTMLDENDKKIQIEFEMTLVPSKIKFTIYLMDKFTSWALNSERFDFKARAHEEDLESRREWYSSNMGSILGDVFVLEPLSMRGRALELTIKFSWDPCFAILRWNHGDCCMHVAVRPSPPYRTWVKDNLAPVTWQSAVSHCDRILDRARNSRTPIHEPSPSSAAPVISPKPPCPPPPFRSVTDSFCQTTIHTAEGFCQTVLTPVRDSSTSPDLVHLETTLVAYRPIEYYHVPWPVVWVTVFDEFGVIHGTLWTMPVPEELVVPVNQFPPESTHETFVPVAYDFAADSWMPVPPHRPNFRPPPLLNQVANRPPPPAAPRPQPPAEQPGYIPIPPGIRAVYTTPALLLRSQPEMNHPRRQIAPAIRDGAAVLGQLNVVEVAKRWAVRLDANPEINPTL